MTNMLEPFDSIRIINLVDRTDRRIEMVGQLHRIGISDNPGVSFFPALRPEGARGFPSLGARGCFESHLAIVRQALADSTDRLLILEDDLDFFPNLGSRGDVVRDALAANPWDIFYGTPILEADQDQLVVSDEHGLVELASDMSVQTTSCGAFGRNALILLEPFLTSMLGRPAGSPDYGPMHVDGAYSVFRRAFPHLRTFVCKPAIGFQRASRSDIASSRFILDRFAVTRPVANRLRRSLARFRR